MKEGGTDAEREDDPKSSPMDRFTRSLLPEDHPFFKVGSLIGERRSKKTRPTKDDS
jgi:hypothetical protein